MDNSQVITDAMAPDIPQTVQETNEISHPVRIGFLVVTAIAAFLFMMTLLKLLKFEKQQKATANGKKKKK